jgi:hypothetical protein
LEAAEKMKPVYTAMNEARAQAQHAMNDVLQFDSEKIAVELESYVKPRLDNLNALLDSNNISPPSALNGLLFIVFIVAATYFLRMWWRRRHPVGIPPEVQPAYAPELEEQTARFVEQVRPFEPAWYLRSRHMQTMMFAFVSSVASCSK